MEKNCLEIIMYTKSDYDLTYRVEGQMVVIAVSGFHSMATTYLKTKVILPTV